MCALQARLLLHGVCLRPLRGTRVHARLCEGPGGAAGCRKWQGCRQCTHSSGHLGCEAMLTCISRCDWLLWTGISFQACCLLNANWLPSCMNFCLQSQAALACQQFYAHSTSLLSDHASALTVVIIIACRLPAPRQSSTLYVQPSSFASNSRRLRSCHSRARVRSVASSPASPCARPARCCRALTRAGQEGW